MKKYDLAVAVGKYESNGQTKSRYKNVGVVMQGDKGMYILLEKTFNPAGVNTDKDTVLISMFEPRDKVANNDLDDSVPF